MVGLIIFNTVILLILACFVVTIMFMHQRKQMSYFETIEKLKHEHEKNILQTQIEMQEQTLQHISREIHDNISLSLTLAKLTLNTLDWEMPLRTKKQVDASLEQIAKAITDLSDLSKAMNWELISTQGLIEILNRETKRLKDLNLFKLDYAVVGNPVFMDSQKELIVFRIIQEAFNNIIKHARASYVKLNLDYDQDNMKVLISDNGKGFSLHEAQQNSPRELNAGLANMRRRAALFNGNLDITTGPNYGTHIQLTLPY